MTCVLDKKSIHARITTKFTFLSKSISFATFSLTIQYLLKTRGGILTITLQATPGTHDEGRLVLALVRATGLFLSFGEPLSYGKLLL